MKLKSLRTQAQICFAFICLSPLTVAGIPVLHENQQTLLVGNGSEVESHEFPWQVSLRSGLDNLHFCGGVIIDQRTVLTTASCAEFLSPYFPKAVAGNLNLNLTDVSGFQQIIQVSSAHIHPNYAANSDHSNDIAILKTNAAFQWTEAVGPIPALHKSDAVSTESGIISGWGTKLEEEITLQDKLQKATLKVINSNQECQGLIDDDPSAAVLVEDSMICIISPNSNETLVDSCTGDQGGPLIFYEDGSPVLLGLVSFGIGCGRPNMPSFCTRISSFIEFIEQYQES